MAQPGRLPSWIARSRQAEAGPRSPWAQLGCLAIGAGAAWVAASALARPGDDLAEARRLGVISATTLSGYAKSQDLRAYGIALSVGFAVSLSAWIAWCLAPRRALHAASPSPASAPPPAWRRWELLPVALVLALGLFRRDLAVNGWDAPYTFYAEEGEALAWADVAFHGGVLARDTYCLYGPLATVPVAAAFKLLSPSVEVWRLTFYLLDLPALLAVYALLRELGRSRRTAWAGVALVALHRMWPMPGMSWCLLRTGLGLAAFTALARFFRTRERGTLAAAGAILGVAVFFSQEAGLAACVAAALALSIDHLARRPGRGAAAGSAVALFTGFVVAVAAVLAPFALRGAVLPLIHNLVGFAKLRVLGHGGQRIPSLFAAGGDRLEAVSLYAGPVLCAAVAFHAVVRLLASRATPDLLVRLALAAYGLVLFVSPLSRPDTTHILFATPPVFVLSTDLLARLVQRVRRSPEAARTRLAYAAAAVAVAALLLTFRTDTGDNVRIFAHQAVSNLIGRDPDPAPDGSRALVLPRAGGVRVPADRADEIEGALGYVLERTRPGEPVWMFPNEPMLGFLADRPPANPYPLTLFAITRDQRRDLIDAVERSGAIYAIVNERPSMVDDIPSRRQNPEPWEYLESRFAPEQRFGRLTVMRRIPEVVPR